MDTWTLQTGFPVVTVTRDYNSTSIRFQQKKFEYADEVGKKKHTEKTHEDLWWIPITFTTSNVLNFNETRPSSWMRKTKELVIEDVEINNLDWLIVNVQQTGKTGAPFFRFFCNLFTERERLWVVNVVPMFCRLLSGEL